jgi:hypothetical protein
VALFAFTYGGSWYGDNEFVVEIKKDADVEHARLLLTGVATDRPHIMGRIIKRKKEYNPAWSYYLDPETVSFFDAAIEVCDSSSQYLEDHLDEACGAFLPGCYLCPWASKLTREVVDA